MWRQFNKFIIRLDSKPGSWEKCIVLFVAHLIDQKRKSSTIKSYLSAIRSVLKTDGQTKLNEDLFLLTSLIKACKLKNDKVKTRLPISKGILKKLVHKTKLHFEGPQTTNQQPYLSLLYQTMFTVAYYGLFRVGEITKGTHPILAKDVQIAFNKKKLLFKLHTSKTHDKGSVSISSTDKTNESNNKSTTHDVAPCPYQLMRKYGKLRGPYKGPQDPFFVFKDGTPVTPDNFRACLKLILEEAGYDPKKFSGHSFRIGRSIDLFKLGLSVETIKKIGRWRSNAVFKYLKC